MTQFYFPKKPSKAAFRKCFFYSSLWLFCGILLQQTAFAQLNAEGWTELDPSKASKIIYVSSSEGDDASGLVYAAPLTELGADPQHPEHPVKAFRTIAAAEANVEQEEAAWILLKTGDTFYEVLNIKSGKSVNEPAVYSYYGEGTEAPLLKTGPLLAIRKDRASTFKDFKHAHSWIIGLSFYAHTRNPDDPDYEGYAGEQGFFYYAGGGYTIENVLIEGCKFSYYTNNVINGAGTIRNIKIRRNVFHNNYNPDDRSQGLFTDGVDGILLEENIFDHNGWLIQARGTSGEDKTDGQATYHNHNTYFANTKNTTFTGNSFHRGSSMGTKWSANNGEASASNIEIINNLYHDNEIGISMGGNAKEPPYRFKSINITENVITSTGKSNTTNRNVAWNVEIEDWDGGVFNNNLIIHQNLEERGNTKGIDILGQTRDLLVDNNILYNLKRAHFGLSVSAADLTNVTISNNEISLDLPAADRFYAVLNPVKTDIFSQNNYHTLGESDLRFKVEGNTTDFEGWIAATGETGASTLDPAYPDPDRRLELYVAEVLNLPDMDAYYAEIRKQSKLNWNEALSAPAINSWIKEGFDSGDVDPSDSYVLTVLNGAGSGKYKEGAVVEIAANVPEPGFLFDAWSGDTAFIADIHSDQTTITMPARNVTVTATYRDNRAKIQQTFDAPGIDGLIDSVWQNAQEYQIKNLLSGIVENDADLSGSFKVMWDTTNLYVLVDVKDDALVQLKKGANVWNFDGIEIFIDGDFSRGTSFDGKNDFQFTYSQGAGLLFSNPAGNLQNMETAEQLTEDGYRVEFKMPWTTLATIPEVESFVGLEVGLNDNDDLNSDVREAYKSWHRTKRAFFGNTTTYGVAQLIGVRHSLNIIAENGTVSVDPDQEFYAHGQLVTLTASPAHGYQFEGWSGDAEGDNRTITIEMDADKTVTASFTQRLAIIQRTSSAPVVDGMMDAAWENAPEHAINNVTSGTVDDESDLSGSFRLIWDHENLYVLMDVKDQTLVTLPEGGQAWNFDGFEILIDGDFSRGTVFDGDNDFQFTYNAGVEQIFSNPAGNLEGIVTAETLNPEGYLVELKIPWTTLNTLPVTDSLIGLEVAINDNDDPHSVIRETYMAWNAVNRFFWGNTSLYGIAQFQGIDHRLSIVAENGTVQINPEHAFYADGDTVILTALPDDGYVFNGWTGDLEGEDATVTIVMDSDKYVVALFEEVKSGYTHLKLEIVEADNGQAFLVEVDWLTETNIFPSTPMRGPGSTQEVALTTNFKIPKLGWFIFSDNKNLKLPASGGETFTLESLQDAVVPVGIRLTVVAKPTRKNVSGTISNIRAYGSADGENWVLLFEDENIIPDYESIGGGLDMVEYYFDPVKRNSVFASSDKIFSDNKIQKDASEFLAWPNPVVDVVNVSLTALQAEDQFFSLYNSRGVLVREGILTAARKADQPVQIDFSGLGSGMYFLKIGSEIRKLMKK